MLTHLGPAPQRQYHLSLEVDDKWYQLWLYQIKDCKIQLITSLSHLSTTLTKRKHSQVDKFSTEENIKDDKDLENITREKDLKEPSLFSEEKK